ncbi:MAG: phosphodiester glycosidase family protein [Lachnospiraceae bacterium]
MNTEQKEQIQPSETEKKPSFWKTVRKVLWRTTALLLTTVLLLVGGIVGLVYTFNYGPSPSARSLFVSSVLETSAIGFLATWFLPSEEIRTILSNNTVEELDTVTNPNLIKIPDAEENPEYYEENDIEIVEVSGLTYSGRMMIVKDPSRVKVGVCANVGQEDKAGEKLISIVKRYDAIAGINGGGFYDPNGQGTGSIPTGFVFSEGKYLCGSLDTSELLIGFDNNNKLIVGYMTGNEAKELGIRDALTFGPALIVNGEPANISGQSSGINPRTAIGQREDGAVLLLVIDGRQANSLGASHADTIDIMLSFGAVNAANLDGGSSSLMVYNGEVISNKSSLTGDRRLPTCFLVERRDSDVSEE